MGILAVAGDVLEQIADRDAHDTVHEIAVRSDMIDEILDVHTDDAVDEIVVVDDAQLTQDLTEKAVLRADRLCIRCKCRHCRETERQHKGQDQTQYSAYFLHGICLLCTPS